MSDCLFVLRILFISCCFLTVHCAQPNCTSVTDFHDCPGNTTDFCPRNIICACKDEKPFCKCPNFRGQWGDYWYMGAKCEQLWSTLDLILVATLPGIGLALIVGVTIQTVNYCKKKSKKNVNDHREQRSLSTLHPQHNSAYAFESHTRPQPHHGQNKTSIEINELQSQCNSASVSDMVPSYQHRAKNPWSSSQQGILSESPMSSSPPFSRRNYNFMIHDPQEDSIYSNAVYNWESSRGMSKPETTYGTNYYSSSVFMKPTSNLSTPGIPKSSYIPKEKQHNRYSTSEEPVIPNKIGRVQMKFNY